MARGVSEAGLRRQTEWGLTWQKLMARYATDQRLVSHFKAHRRHFDGTRLRVRQILLKANRGDDPAAATKLAERAMAIRQSIASGEVSFADAARRYSAAPSSTEGGDIGSITRHGAMVESFARAAFALKAGEVSEPVPTRFGIHLILCDAVEPGKLTLADVRPKVEQSLARELTDKLSRLQRKISRVKFTGKGPYLKPGTRELVRSRD